MNPLDELLSSTGRVPGITPDALGNARAALDAAIAGASAQQDASMRPSRRDSRKLASRRLGGLRGTTIIGVAAAAAAAAAAIVLPLPASHPGTHPLADSSAKAPVKAKPSKTAAAAAVPVTVPPVTYSFSAATTDATAAHVLDQAAQAAGAQPADGWPNTPYWHTVQQWTCGGKVYTGNTWIDRAGNGVGQIAGPPSSDPSCAIAGGGAPYSIFSGGNSGVSIGEKQYTWSELDALPTDPAKLWPIVRADEQLPFSSDPALPKSGQSDLFQSIWNLLTSGPVSPALRKALYEVSAEIPGVTVTGKYTDSLGRTGTALHIGLWTMVTDTSNGQVLAMLQGATPPVTVCSDSGGCHEVQTGGASTTVYISAGPAGSAPSVPKQNGSVGAGVGAAPSATPTSSSGSSR